jgi:hypothetical protein
LAGGLNFTIDGTFKGSPVKGVISPGGLMCAQVGSAGNPLTLVTWSGTVGASTNNPNKQVSGEVRGAPATYGGPGGEGIASITIAGDYANSPIWESGTFTINPDTRSGTVDLKFGPGPDEVTLKGTFNC